MIKILFFGDIIGKIGRKALSKVLPQLKKKLKPDLVLANVENLAHGSGVTKKTLEEIKKAGVDFFTSGNHVWKKKEVFKLFEDKDFKDILIRPANYPKEVPGQGYKIIKTGKYSLVVINLSGRVFMEENLDCPFHKIDEILNKFHSKKINGLIIDFHAEATSEKVAFGFYVDGRVSAVLGTHTHIGTSEAGILPQGTGYLTDIGMVGAKDSVIGVKKENAIRMFLTQIPETLEPVEKGEVIVNSVYLEIDPKTKKTTRIERVDLETKV